jgi:hypothetical protein
MKKTLLILILICTCSFGYAQGLKFKKSYGNTGFDFGRGLLQLADSSYLITGSSSSNAQNSADAFIMHVDSLGELINTWFYGGAETEWGEKIVIGADSSIAIAGYTNTDGNGGFDFYFFKTDIDKNLLVEKTYGGEGWDFAYGLAALPDSGYIMVGETSSFEAVGTDAYMIRIDKFGDTVWTKQYGNVGNDSYRSIKKISDTDFIVTGSYQHPDSTHLDGLVQRINMDGDIIWEELFGDTFDQTLYAIDTLESTVVVGGESEKENGESVGQIIKLDFDGNLLWSNALGLSENFRINSLIAHKLMSSVVLATETNSTAIPAYPDGMDIIISSYDFYISAFNAIIHKSYGGVGNDEARQIINTLDNGPALIGSTSDYSNGGSNVMFIKIGNDFSYVDNNNWELDSILDIQKEIQEIQVAIYPNPTTETLNFIKPTSEAGIIHVFDIEGRLILNQKITSTSTELNVSNWNKGIYTLNFIQNGKVRSFKKFIKQ